jgi:hypothetical protein
MHGETPTETESAASAVKKFNYAAGIGTGLCFWASGYSAGMDPGSIPTYLAIGAGFILLYALSGAAENVVLGMDE